MTNYSHFLLSLIWLVQSFGAPAYLASAPGQNGTGENNGTVMVVTKPLEPFVIFQENGELSGFSIELWEAIAQDLSLDYEWVRVDEVTEQLAAVESDQADVAIAGISMTPDREQVIDFTHPYFDAGLQIMTSAQTDLTPDSLISIIISPALLRVLGLGVLTLLVMAHIIWLIERKNNETMPKGYLPGIWESLWWSLSTIATLEYGTRKSPTTMSNA